MSQRPYLIVPFVGAARVAWMRRVPIIPRARLIFDLAAGARVAGKATLPESARMIEAAAAIIAPAMREYQDRVVRPLLPVGEAA